MTTSLNNKKGTTLVELMVCLVLLALFGVAAVTLVKPSAEAYISVQQLTRAQNLADALIETIRGEVLEANGYIRFTDGATESDDLDKVFASKGNDYSKGTALEFSVYPNHVELIDKDCVPALTKTDGTALLTQEQANALNGYVLMRFYRDELNDEGHYGNPQHKKKNKDENGTVTVTQPYVAYGYTTAYPRDAYMGLFISDLRFYARSWTQDGEETKTPRITAMTVVLTVAKRDANNQIVPLCTQKAIVQLPGEPVILYEPGTWDGNPSSES